MKIYPLVIRNKQFNRSVGLFNTVEELNKEVQGFRAYLHTEGKNTAYTLFPDEYCLSAYEVDTEMHTCELVVHKEFVELMPMSKSN